MKWLLSVVVAAALLSGVYAVPTAASTGQGGSFVPLTPALIADTRSGLGLPSTGTVPAGAERTIQVSGRGGVPTTGVSAVVLDFSAESNVNTAISAYPAGTTRDLGILSVSGAEERAANTAIIRLGTGGKIVVHNAKGNTDFNVGVQGYFTTTSTSGSTGLAKSQFTAVHKKVLSMNLIIRQKGGV